MSTILLHYYAPIHSEERVMKTDSVPFTLVARAIEYLYDHFQEQPDLDAVAAQVHVSPQHLQRQFQALAGVSPKKMLQYLSIEHAKAVLQAQGSVQDAAYAAGLSGSGRLHDLFVSIEGMTPGEYKNGGAGLNIAYAFADSPFGEVLVAATDKGICRLAFADERDAALAALRAEFPQAVCRERAHPLHQRALAVFGGGNPQTVPLHLKGTPFQLKVWQALLRIPAGALQSYGGIAAGLGQAKAARAVGSAVGSNPVAVLIPCHRVIRESGVIGQYRWQRGRKMALLARELGDGHSHRERYSHLK
ncbi:AraC family transcriptional regulator of adaptative response/methylated-DNA-[protein]-cysteine methyltransferase [Neisseria sp. HSC-16F19]|nr:AraC family transcriptional regulator of adaptative response/methylated-DNA-[protein]-cysteine methyltransferase [Neisseria sp. HSC-16F19]